MEKEDYGIMKMHALNGAQGQSNGAALYSENLRYDYLEGKEKLSFAESTGVRNVTESGSGRARQQADGGGNTT